MNILIIGNGGREHALAWKIAQSKHCKKLFIAPGNAGTGDVGENVPIGVNDFPALHNFCVDHEITLVVVGPEEPLVQGIVDFFAAQKSTLPIAVLGPTRAAAQLEGSKDYAKAFMKRHNIPTAKALTVSAENIDEGLAFLAKQDKGPYVLKADGLCAGKGVLILDDRSKAEATLKTMVEGQFGKASQHVIIEEHLAGRECSLFVLTDGDDYKILPVAKDYKRRGTGNSGPNTGGMGAVSPVPFADEAWRRKVEEQIIRPTLAGMKEEGTPYRGFLFLGLITSDDGAPKVIEYNCRMGDPETQVVVPRITSDLVLLLYAAATGTLRKEPLTIDQRCATTVVAVSRGYPGAYEKGFPITGISHSSALLFHAGTAWKAGDVVTNGGRVLAATALAETTKEALAASYKALTTVAFEGMDYRKDIGRDLQ